MKWTSNLPDAEFKTMVIWMLNKCRGGVDELSKNINSEVGKVKCDRKQNKKRTKNEECNN